MTPHQVEVLQWFVAEGQTIKAFDRICEVQSDKATVEISSRYDGKVRHTHIIFLFLGLKFQIDIFVHYNFEGFEALPP
jgi:hypothetical protein